MKSMVVYLGLGILVGLGGILISVSILQPGGLSIFSTISLILGFILAVGGLTGLVFYDESTKGKGEKD